ncbi:GNAT family N-acetyltransferase [Kiloniella spongiae]|uniref:GNAT family N-acetyltransferase n=1 Tax=Kiloniella spongiae TaxID=1489064 RepID=UPI00069A2D58|nr:GNAT family N-acetyltransferase [Kiloniella spongiae]
MIKLDQQFKQNPVTNNDTSSLIELVRSCYEEYIDQGVVFDIHEETELLESASYFENHNGELLGINTTNEPTQLIAVCGYIKPDSSLSKTPLMELKKLYVAPEYRGYGLAQYRVNKIIKEATNRHIAELFLWTDTRFTKAHQLYKKLGFSKQKTTRKLSDKSHSEEFCYRLLIKNNQCINARKHSKLG